MKFWKKLMFVGAGLLLAVSLSACGNSSANSKKTTITIGYWGDSGETKVYKEAIKYIESQDKTISVKLQHYPSSNDFWNNLPAQIAAKKAPDVVVPTNEGNVPYMKQGLFLPVDKYYKANTTDYAKKSLDAWSYNDHLYAYPMTATPAVFVINKKMWKAAGLTDYPTTWAGVYTAAQKLTANGKYGICINFAQAFHTTQFVKSFGGGWDNGKTINSKENAQAVDYIFKMFKEKLAVNSKDLGYSWDGEVFAAGKAAMTTGGAWYIGFMKGAAPKLDYDIVPIPSGDGQTGSAFNSRGAAVIKGTKNAKVAAKVAYLMTSKTIQNKYAKAVGETPSRNSLTASYFKENPKMQTVESELKTGSSFDYPLDPKFQSALSQSMEEIIYAKNSKTTGQEMLDSLADKYKAD